MRQRIRALPVLLLVVALAALAAASSAASQDLTGTVRIVGPWSGADEQSFRAVLDGFTQRNPGVTVAYASAANGVPTLIRNASGQTAPHLAVLSLPGDLAAMRELARGGTLKPIEFAVPDVTSSYSFSWKAHGSVDGKLYGLFFKATNRSAFWHDARTFRTQGIAPPASWFQLQRVADRLYAAGVKPFAIAGSGGLLTNLFENVYLMQQGSSRYDGLSRGTIPWTGGAVADTMRTMRDVVARPLFVAGGLSSLGTPSPEAVQRVFGSPPTAAMVIGGSDVIPVLRTAKAVRPIGQFGVFPFPTIGTGPARVIGEANAVVMTADTPAARALVRYLATPQAAEIWAKRGDFLSPNRKLDTAVYPNAWMRALGSSLASADVFRFSLAELVSPTFKATLDSRLAQFLRTPSQLGQITQQLQAASIAA